MVDNKRLARPTGLHKLSVADCLHTRQYCYCRTVGCRQPAEPRSVQHLGVVGHHNADGRRRQVTRVVPTGRGRDGRRQLLRLDDQSQSARRGRRPGQGRQQQRAALHALFTLRADRHGVRERPHRRHSGRTRAVLTNGHTGHVPRAPGFFFFLRAPQLAVVK